MLAYITHSCILCKIYTVFYVVEEKQGGNLFIHCVWKKVEWKLFAFQNYSSVMRIGLLFDFIILIQTLNGLYAQGRGHKKKKCKGGKNLKFSIK